MRASWRLHGPRRKRIPSPAPLRLIDRAAGSGANFRALAPLIEVDQEWTLIDQLGLKYELDVQARRGLSYYLRGEGFEILCPVLGAQKQVVGGGAYQEGAGFGIGLERLALALTRQKRAAPP